MSKLLLLCEKLCAFLIKTLVTSLSNAAIMRYIFKLLFTICIIIPACCFAQKSVDLHSPNGDISFSLKIINQSAFYSVGYKGKTIIQNSQLSLKFSDGDFSNNLHIMKPVLDEGQETYELTVGKARKIDEHYQEAFIPLQQTSTPKRKILFAVRIFNDGVAFRYEFPDDQNKHSFILTDENDAFNFAPQTIARALFLPNYTSSHEGPYTTVSIAQMKEDTLMDMPVLFETPDHVFVGVTEANLLDYAGMYLMKEKGVIRSKLSPLPGQTEIKVKASLPHHSPWRVMLISDRVGALIESNVITNLAEPCRIKDISWIRPGKTTFPWWNGNVVPDTINAPGNNFVTNKYYIDFCARNKIEYHSVVEYGLHEWYTNDGAGFYPGPNADVTKPVPGLNMKEICDYAKSQGVGIRVWVYWTALYKKLDAAFDQFEKWGISGMMVDFLDRDDQEMVNIQTEILEKAVAHHLHIQFHGAYKPTGLNRTYPNEYTREGTRNYEVNKWGEGLTPDHDIYMPFTRMLGGSTDYHLGGFRAVTDSAYIAQYTRPLMLGTRCHMLAMYVVLENYLAMVCDYPAAYEGQPGFEFIKEVPTVWDETIVPDAKVQQYVAIARRKGNDWYVGAINNHEARTVNITLNFLDDGDYTAEIYTDASDVNVHPNNLVKQTKEVRKGENLVISLASGGGAVVRLIKK